jgi:hypothetical protein
VLISFEPDFESVYTNLIKAPLEEAGFVVHRADSELNQQNILRDIVRGIAGADLIVADLTALNPNVFYELGIAHALGIPTILLTQNLDELPFDLRAYRANQYSTHFTEAPEIASTVREVGRGRIDGSISFSSPVTDFLPSDFPRRPPPVSALAVPEPAEDAPAEESPEIAWFDALAESEERSEAFVAAMDRITSATEAVGAKIAQHAGEMDQLQMLPDSQRMRRTTALAARVAHDLDSYADAVEADLPVFESSSSVLIDAMSQYLAWLQSAPGADVEQGVENLSGAHELNKAVRDNLPVLREFRDTVAGLQGFSRSINSAARHVVKALDRLVTETENIEAETARIVSAGQALLERAGPDLPGDLTS